MTRISTRRSRSKGFSLTELMAVVAILGLLAVVAIPRVTSARSDGHTAACHVNRAEIELQAILWRRSTGSFPATNLADIAIDPSYFPEGLPTCPVDGSAYTIGTDGRVVGHDH